MSLYNVHIYREMRIKYHNVEASTPEQAAMRCKNIDPEMCDYEYDIHECEGQTFSALVDDVPEVKDEGDGVPINFEEGKLRDSAHLLLEALQKAAWFIENVNEDTPGRTDLFFEAREAWRNAMKDL